MSRISESLHAELTELRRRFHQIPELGFEERKTADLICSVLDGLGIPYERGIGETGIVATLTKGAGGGTIGLRADIDALPIEETTNLPYRSTHPGRMHACGHDGHTTMLLGAAQMLKESAAFNGTVRFVFQPAEEHGKGALKMLDDGLFERFPVDAIYGLHNMPVLDAGTFETTPGAIMAAEDNFVITIRGQGGHAAMPHQSKDALTLGASIVTELQTIVSRSIDPLQGSVVSCTEFLTDGTTNVIPTTVTIKGDTRSFEPSVSEEIERRMKQIAQGLCDAHGAELEFSYERVFLSTLNTPEQAALSVDVANRIFGTANVDPACAPVMASEDFGAMLRARPGCYAFLGNRGMDGKGAVTLHNSGYDFNDDIIPDGVRYWVSLVETALPA